MTYNPYIEFLENTIIPTNPHYHKRLIKLLRNISSRYSRPEIKHDHHIVPRSWSPNDVSENLNFLTCTPKEHYVLHHLYYKAFPLDKPMALAYRFMVSFGNNRITARTYQLLMQDCQIHLINENRRRHAEYRQNGLVHPITKARKQFGEKNGRFKGYYVTPWGVFASSLVAAKHPNSTVKWNAGILDRCVKINHKKGHLNRYHTLDQTWRELGYAFFTSKDEAEEWYKNCLSRQ